MISAGELMEYFLADEDEAEVRLSDENLIEVWIPVYGLCRAMAKELGVDVGELIFALDEVGEDHLFGDEVSQRLDVLKERCTSLFGNSSLPEPGLSSDFSAFLDSEDSRLDGLAELLGRGDDDEEIRRLLTELLRMYRESRSG